MCVNVTQKAPRCGKCACMNEYELVNEACSIKGFECSGRKEEEEKCDIRPYII